MFKEKICWFDIESRTESGLVDHSIEIGILHGFQE